MLQKIPGASRSPSGRNKKEQGFILLIAVIIITAVVSVILVKTSLNALTGLNNSVVNMNGMNAEYQADSCAQEALLNLNRDNTYAGGNFALGSGNCVVIVSGSDNTRTINATGILNNYYRSLNINVTLSPFAITSWDN
ncbi:MAG: hypothetical protein V1928_00880 [Parcubacteria group bacterium]